MKDVQQVLICKYITNTTSLRHFFFDQTFDRGESELVDVGPVTRYLKHSRII